MTQQNPDSSRWLGWLLAVASTAVFSLVTPLGKLALDGGFHPTAILSLRFGLAALLLALAMVRTAPHTLRPDRRGFFVAGLAGVVNGLGAVGFFWSLRRLDSSVATMLFALSPLFVLAMLALRGEKFTYRQWIRLGLGLLGVYLLIGPGGQVDLGGVLLVLGGIVGFTLEITLVQWFLPAHDTRTVTLYVLVGMWLAITGLWLAQGLPWSQPGWLGWVVLLIISVVSTFFGWWAMFRAVQVIGSGQYALLLPVETLLAILWSFLFLGETLLPLQILGGGLILVSAMLAVQRLGRIPRRRRWRIWLRNTR
ncbi:MAG: DMT family transporter [Anaerolineaceae bacterium]|nr:DMT family transporter [Anaerolineaceae bacterium]